MPDKDKGENRSRHLYHKFVPPAPVSGTAEKKNVTATTTTALSVSIRRPAILANKRSRSTYAAVLPLPCPID